MKPSLLLLLLLSGVSPCVVLAVADDPAQPPKVVAFLEQSTALCKDGHYEDAQKLLESRLGTKTDLLDSAATRVQLQNALADVHRQWGDSLRSNPANREEALHHYQIAYESDQSLRRLEAERDLMTIGDLHNEQSRRTEAMTNWSLALDIVHDLKDRGEEEELEMHIARLCRDLGEYASALAHYKVALAICQERGDKLNEGWTYHGIGSCQLNSGKTEEAVPNYKSALSIFQQINCVDGQKRTLYDLGYTFIVLEDSENSTKYLELGLPFFIQAKDKAGEARMTYNLGRSQERLGNYEIALNNYKIALSIYKNEYKNQRSEAEVETAIGKVYLCIDQYQQSISHYENAKTIFINIGVIDRAGESLVDIARSYDALGNEQETSRCLNEALEIGHKIHSRGIEVGVGFVNADIHVRQGRYDLAYNEYQDALMVYRGGKGYEAEATVLNRLANLCIKKKDFDHALEFLNLSFPLARRLQHRGTEAVALAAQMDVYQARNQTEAAILFGKQSVNVIQSVRRDMKGLDQGDKDAYLNGKTSVYRELVRLLIDAGRTAEADEVLNMLQQQEFLDSVRGDARGLELINPATTYNMREESAIREQDAKISSVVTLTEEKVKLEGLLQRTEEQNKRLEEVTSQLQQAKTDLDNFFAALSKRFQRSDTQVEKDRSSLQHIRALLKNMGGKSAYIWGFVDDQGLELLVTMPSGPTVVLSYKPTAKELKGKTFTAWLNTRIHDFNRAISERRNVVEVQAQARALYDVIFCRGQLANQLKGTGINTLMWRLTGTLRSVPFPALCDQDNYLVRKYAQLMLTAGSSERNLAHIPSASWRALGAGISQARTVGSLRFNALPAAELELGTVVHDPGDGFGKGILPGRVLLNNKFTKDAFFKELQSKTAYQLVHISSHFEAGADPAKSFLLTGDKENALLPMDAFRASSTAPSPFKGVELVTLSACNTAKSVAVDGSSQGADSLAAMVEKSGSRAVLATLWAVADKQTAQFMGDFYRFHKANAKQSKLWALHQAQLKMLQTAPHPYYWAPFVLTGNGR